MTDTSPAAVAQMISAPWCYASADIADTLRAVVVERDAALANQCCMCGKRNLSTAEDGGPECQMHDGRWVCSSVCWDTATDPAAVVAERDALAASLVIMDINPASVIAAMEKDKADG